ncbi:MAG: NADH-quinone oxidoreductase subunit J family protein [Conexivisphaera sp.]|jgi:NADH-quinone oxidoreductase subunit J|nr:NADH-quinone oxidoreductase subunit J [Conexivisphaerales archaeon]
MNWLFVWALVMGFVSLIAAYYVVRAKDFVYASSALAVLGSIVAADLAILGFGIISAFLVIVYVGAAVMFIIITLSLLGLREEERRNSGRGVIVALLVAALWSGVALSAGIYGLYVEPQPVSMTTTVGGLLSRYSLVVALIVIAQAATLVEAISVARRGRGN